MLVSPPPSRTSASAVDPSDASGIGAQIALERVRTLYELTPPPVMAGAGFALLVALMMAPVAPPLLTAGWLGLKLLMAALRIVDAAAFRRCSAPAPALRGWLARYLTLMTIDAISWGGMTVVFMPYAHGIASTVLLAGAVGVASVGVFTTFSHWSTSLVYLVSVLAPIMVDQLAIGERDNLLTAAALLIYFGVLAFEGWRSESRLVEMLRLRYQNAWIAEQRRQALALAEHSSAAKSRFLAAVSHEMRTPLNGILGMTQLLGAQVSDPHQRHQLEVMRRSARHLQTVIADLLDLSRIEFGRLEIELEPFILTDTVREVSDLLSAVAAEKGLAFRVLLQPGLPARACGDASRIKQVLHNLLGNAIKFTREGGITLEVAATPEGLAFTVRDTGQGIALEEAERIFDAFAQAGEGAARRAGTGLGLTISRQLARAMGGDVRYQGEPSGGAAFVFTVAAAPMPTEDAALPRAWAAQAFQLRGHVLVVDDSPVNAMVAGGMLERFGLSVDLAEDGEQALQRLHTTRYDAVLMDCQMPGMDGFEATRRWRAQEAAAMRLPIIAVTANAVPGDRERCLAAGMDDYLAKPFDLNELGALLQRHLAGCSTAAPAPAAAAPGAPRVHGPGGPEPGRWT
ncbi:response regulator [Ideonella sp. BN130291]|uniref:response regulator n=1 Tax=Ideonella sp. BN130291 TaxID=3112940 RepID=UPI002E26C3E1|nr:response regulator [Ideonella sp. BN130291]